MRKRWEIKPIGDVCDLMTGGTPSKTRREYFNGGKIKWLVSGDIHQKEITECDGRITELGLENSNAKYLPINSVLIALNGQGKTRGTVAILRTKATCNQSLVSITPKDDAELLPEYIYCYLHGKYEEIRKMTGDSGNDRRGLNMPLIRSISIPIPPLPEQKQIVAILDKAFAAIDRAKAIAKQNLRNARELFDSYLNEVFTNKGVDWEEKRLEEIGSITSSKRIFKSEYVSAGIPFYRTKEIKELANGKKITTELFISTEKYHYLKDKFSVPQTGDILLTAIGTIGEIYVLDNDQPFYFKDGNVLWLKDFKNIDSYYLKYVLMSFVENIKRLSHGAAYNALPIERLNKYTIYLPPLYQQVNIVTQLDSLATQTQQFEKIYQQKIDNLEELKKSILQRAFAGELTAAPQAIPA